MTKDPKLWQCQECGRRMTLRQAERAVYGADGCSRCGGTDIELVEAVRVGAPPITPKPREAA